MRDLIKYSVFTMVLVHQELLGIEMTDDEFDRNVQANGWCSAQAQSLDALATVTPVPRNCGNRKLDNTCDSLCHALKGRQNERIGAYKCVSAMHVDTLKRHEDVADAEHYGTTIMKTLFYVTGCAETGCGPNFCCCLLESEHQRKIEL